MASTQWNEVDKFRFFTIGTFIYSGLTILVHPVSVLKTRQQVLLDPLSSSGGTATNIGSSARVGHQLSLRHVARDLFDSSRSKGAAGLIGGFRGFYKGLGVVLSVAIPARVVYVLSLEGSREVVAKILSPSNQSNTHTKHISGSTMALSSGLAGGIAAVSAQVFAVPMDIIAQRQMVMGTSYIACNTTTNEPRQATSAISVLQSILRTEGPVGLYRGFGISLFISLPAGSIWWATYGWCQQETHRRIRQLGLSSDGTSCADSGHLGNKPSSLLQAASVQLISGVSAAAAASILTQPLDVVKTRLQVQKHDVNGQVGTQRPSLLPIARNLAKSCGVRGFYRGLVPRIMHVALWSTLLSSAYEYLKHVSRKEFLFELPAWLSSVD